MTGKISFVILILVILTFTLVGCDVFNEDTVDTMDSIKTGEGASIAEVQSLEKLYVDPGTEEDVVIDKLENERDTVDLLLTNDTEAAAEIAWEGSNGNYNSEEPGVYKFEGTFLYNDLSTDITIEVVVDNKLGLILEIKGEGEILDKEGNIILSSPKNKKEIRYEPGSTLELTAISHESWMFMGWEGAQNTDESTVEITMDEHKEMQAVFGNVGNISIYDIEKNFLSVDWSVSGKLENLTGSKIESVEIHVELYDGEEVFNSSYVRKINIAEGEVVAWEVRGVAYPRSDSYYKIILKNLKLAE